MKKLFALMVVASLAAIGCDDKKTSPPKTPTTSSIPKPPDTAGRPSDPTTRPADPTAKPADPTAKPADPTKKPPDKGPSVPDPKKAPDGK